MPKSKWIRIEKINDLQWIVSWYNPIDESLLPANPTCQMTVDPNDGDLPAKLGSQFLPQIGVDEYFLFEIGASGDCKGWRRQR